MQLMPMSGSLFTIAWLGNTTLARQERLSLKHREDRAGVVADMKVTMHLFLAAYSSGDQEAAKSCKGRCSLKTSAWLRAVLKALLTARSTPAQACWNGCESLQQCLLGRQRWSYLMLSGTRTTWLDSLPASASDLTAGTTRQRIGACGVALIVQKTGTSMGGKAPT